MTPKRNRSTTEVAKPPSPASRKKTIRKSWVSRLTQPWLSRWRNILSQLQPSKWGNALRSRLLLVSVVGLLVLAVGVVGLTLVPAPFRFQANIETDQFGFRLIKDRTAKKNEAFLMSSVRGVKNITVTGAFSVPVTLDGTFRVVKTEKLLAEKSLTIDLAKKESVFEVEVLSLNSASDLEIADFSLAPPVTVRELSFNTGTNELGVVLKPDPKLENSKKAGDLRLHFGSKPLRLHIEGRVLSPNPINGSGSSVQVLDLEYLPEGTNFTLPLPQDASVMVLVPAIDSTESENWFRPNWIVDKVSFEDSLQSGSESTYNLDVSTILKGSILVNEDELLVEPEQFLSFGRKDPGIEIIRSLKIEKPHGLRVKGLGRASVVSAGLDLKLPLRQMKTSVLVQWLGLSKDFLIALLSFLSAIIISLFMWLVNYFSETSAKKRSSA
jgi:hypothetical protein